MNDDIMHFAPQNWDRTVECGEFPILRGTQEFTDVEYDLLKAIRNAERVKSLTRIQNVYDFGQFLMRSQIVVLSNSEPLYKVRRYVAIPKNDRNMALKHNLDHRRLTMGEITYQSHLSNVQRSELIFVVTILSHDERETQIKPYNFTEYYIDYVAEMEFY